ncbi:hypothetical protein N7G274_002491 [Stereocaulon virgatum]|uniref:Uncharacterized protein n=1 Tax=Stereocaulon virgatum TaxID=373712 RepID=A0ABR4AJ77_9LECA
MVLHAHTCSIKAASDHHRASLPAWFFPFIQRHPIKSPSITSEQAVMRLLLFLLCIPALLYLCAALPPTPLTPLASLLPQPRNSQLRPLEVTSSTQFNTTTSHITTWPTHLPFRYALPGHKSTYFIVSSYMIPEPQFSSEVVLSTIISMVQRFNRGGEPGDTFTSIKLQEATPANVTWNFERERPYFIDRQTAVIVLNAVANMEVEYGVANLKNVLFQQNGRFYGTFNLTAESSPEAMLPHDWATQPVAIDTS